jgi:neutral ceramidase
MSDILHSGVGRVDITPHLNFPMGLWRAARHLRAEGVHMPLHATCLVLGTLTSRIAIVNLELMLLSVNQARAIQEAVSLVVGIDIENVWVFVTHNHAGPATLETYTGDGELEVNAYIRSLPVFCADAASKAVAALTPVRVASGKGACHIGVNRDLKLPDGSFIIAPNSAGFSDSEVGVIKIDDLDGNPIAVIANYSCHPTIAGHENRLLSPDYPGYARKIVEDITGAKCIFLQGAAGNVGPQEGFTSDLRVVERLGAILGCEIAKVALQTMTLKTQFVLDRVVPSMSAQLAVMKSVEVVQSSQEVSIGNRKVKLPTGNPYGHSYVGIKDEIRKMSAELAEMVSIDSSAAEIANKGIAINRLLWMQARGIRLMEKSYCSVDIKVLCIGDIALVGTWGEMFSETGFEIKERSQFGHTLVAAYMGGDAAYLPLRADYTNPARLEVMNTPIAPGGAELLSQAISDLLSELKIQYIKNTQSTFINID